MALALRQPDEGSTANVDICLSLIADESEMQRFHSKYKITRSGCWEWQGKLSTGYGRFCIKGRKSVLAHRLSYAFANKSLPVATSQFVIDHICRNRQCVNPEHLHLITRGMNVLIGKTIAATNSAKIECHKGHRFSKSNTRIDSLGRRICATCRRERDRANYSKKRNQQRKRDK